MRRYADWRFAISKKNRLIYLKTGLNSQPVMFYNLTHSGSLSVLTADDLFYVKIQLLIEKLPMLKLKHIALSFIILAAPAFTANAASSPESIKKLLVAMDARKQVDSMLAQMEESMKSNIKQSLQGQDVTPKQQKIIDDMQSKTISVLRDGLDWGKLEPMYVRVYSDAFTQEETDAILAFYDTPAGQAFLKKMPQVAQKSGMEMRTHMNPMMEKIQKIQQDASEELKAQQPKGKK